MNEVKRLLNEIISYEENRAGAHGIEPNKVYQWATQALARLDNVVKADFTARTDLTETSELLPTG